MDPVGPNFILGSEKKETIWSLNIGIKSKVTAPIKTGITLPSWRDAVIILRGKTKPSGEVIGR